MAEPKSAPDGLGSEALVFWEAVLASYKLRPDELRLLEDACREIDLIERMNDALGKRKTPMVKGSMGQQRVNPLYQEVRQHRLALAVILKQLKLPSLDGEGEGEKQLPRGNDASTSARRAAIASWGGGVRG